MDYSQPAIPREVIFIVFFVNYDGTTAAIPVLCSAPCFKMAITTTFAIRRIGTSFWVLVMRISLICHAGVINRRWNTLGLYLCRLQQASKAYCKSDDKIDGVCFQKG
jgi:hypothetical protein